MKILKIFVIAVVVFTAAPSFSQSMSFEKLYDRFSGTEDVNCFSINGFLCRAGLWVAGEHEFKEAIEKVKSLRLITIPNANFTAQGLSVRGFKKVLSDDDFESLVTLREETNRIEVYLQKNSNLKNLYFFLVEDANTLTAIEIKGDIDINKLRKLAFENKDQRTL
jgi:Domain of unknown function (DUF4252)